MTSVQGKIGILTLLLLLPAGCGQRAQPPGKQPSASDPPKAPSSRAQSSGDELTVATRAIAQNDLPAAERALRNRLMTHPEDHRALEMTGDIAARRGDKSRAVEMYRAAVEKSDTPTGTLLEKLAQQLMASGLAFDSVDVLLERIDHHPNDPQARFDLLGLATMLGVPQIAVPSMRWLAQHGHGDPDSLLALSNPERVEPDPRCVRNFWSSIPKILARSLVRRVWMH